MVNKDFLPVDPRLVDWPLAGTPVTPIIILISYLYFIYRRGPQFMEHRKPYKLRAVMLIYNGLQVIANALIVVYVCFQL